MVGMKGNQTVVYIITRKTFGWAPETKNEHIHPNLVLEGRNEGLGGGTPNKLITLTTIG